MTYKIIEVEAVQGDPGGTPPTGISNIATSHYYVVKQIDALGTSFTYRFTGTYTGTGFTAGNNRLIVQNGSSTYSYPHSTAQSVNTTAQTVSIVDILLGSEFPTSDGKIAFGNGGNTIYWTGSSTGGDGTSWSDANNWTVSPGSAHQVPTQVDDAVIQASGAAINVQISGNTSARASSLIIAGQNSTNTVTISVGGTSSNPLRIQSDVTGALTLNAYSTLQISNSNGIKFYNVADDAYYYIADDTEFKDNTTVIGLSAIIEGDNYYNLTLSYSTGTTNLQTTNATVRGAFVKSGSGSQTFDLQSGQVDVQSDVTISNGILQNGTLRFTGSGSTNQTFSSSVNLTASNLILRVERGAGTGTVALSGNVTSSGTLAMVSGLVTTSTGNVLTVGGATSSSSSSYVDGPLAISGNGTKLFPIGKGGFFRPVKVLTADNGNLQFELYNSAPSGTPATGSGMLRISSVRYWLTNATGLVSGSSVGLGYGSDDGITSTEGTGLPSGVVIASSSNNVGASYQNNSRSGVASESNLGDVTIIQSSSLVTPGNLYFTFGTGDILPDNPLPVELSKFIATTDGKGVILNWTTASETNNQGFIVSRSESKNGPFQQIASYQSHTNLKGQGTTSAETNYRLSDYSATIQSGKTYFYRLEDVNLTGQRNVLGTREVKLPEGYALSQNYPNPFNPSTTINFTLKQDGKTVLEVYNLLGQRVATIVNSELKSGAYSYNWNAAGQTSGVYFYRLASGNFVQTKKMLLVK
ncbi:MAG: T9SS type A sorting domain-containing protein [Desulfobulbaceae bacterium]|nr:T9SS type A sorting domain-containing protein [Desulfobulbaceae bacterium]